MKKVIVYLMMAFICHSINAQELSLEKFTNDFIIRSMHFYDKDRDSSLLSINIEVSSVYDNGNDIYFGDSVTAMIELVCPKEKAIIKKLFNRAKEEGDYDMASIVLLYYLFEREMSDPSLKVAAEFISLGSIEPNMTDKEWREYVKQKWRMTKGHKNILIEDCLLYTSPSPRDA